MKNYWVNDSFPYNGVNAKFKNSRNYRIEIQPFTPVFSLSENNIRPLRTARLEASQGEFFDEA